jgi:DNA-binding MarR family transcriptional regulator/GNAT superfamily N-acetyltransferase
VRSIVPSVRTFNRFYTRIIGVLGDQHLESGLTLGQARVLFEIGQLAPVEARALEAHLALDAGYLSRRLAELEEAKLIRRAPNARDRRAKRIVLTPKGRKKIEVIDQRSDERVQRLIERLDRGARQRLESAMLEIQRLLDDDIEIEPHPPESPEAQACLNGFFSELGRRLPSGFDPAESVSADPEEMRPPLGQFLMVRCGGRPRGCGGVKTLEPGVGEIKRMWIHPELRGRGAGRRLLQALEDEAIALGLRTLRLDTSSQLEEALALYRSAGYVEIEPYNDNPYAAHWFEKRKLQRAIR